MVYLIITKRVNYYENHKIYYLFYRYMMNIAITAICWIVNKQDNGDYLLSIHNCANANSKCHCRHSTHVVAEKSEIKGVTFMKMNYERVLRPKALL